MKKTALVILFVIATSLSVFANETVTLDIGEWAPFTSEKDPDGKIAETIVTEAFKLENIDVVYRYYPWKRSYENAKKGKSDGTFPWYKTEEREMEFIYSDEIMEIREVFFHLKSFDFQWDNFQTLKKYKIGSLIGSANVKLLKENGITVDEVTNPEFHYKKLLAGRIDAFVEDFFVGYDAINKKFKPGKAALFTNHPKPLQQKGAFILFSKKTPNGQEMADKFNKGLAKLKASGRYDKIISEFLCTK